MNGHSALSQSLQCIADNLPSFAHRILVGGDSAAALAKQLEADGRAVDTADPESVAARIEGPNSAVGPIPTSEARTYDAAIVLEAAPPDLHRVLCGVSRCLRDKGLIFLLFQNARNWRVAAAGGEAAARNCATPNEVEDALRDAGFVPYREWDVSEPAVKTIEPDPDGLVVIEGTPFHVATPEAVAELAAVAYVWHAVRESYDPVAHARALYLAGAPGHAYRILDTIPGEYLDDPQVRVLVASEKATCMLAWDRCSQDNHTLHRMHVAQSMFFQATSIEPLARQAYHAYAEFWHVIGHDEIAARLLRSLRHVAPDPATDAQLMAYEPAPRLSGPAIEPPEWDQNRWPRRILLVTDDRPNHGLDTLYDGLLRLLGHHGVSEFPWKPTLHGQPPTRFGYYPCLFDYPGERMDLSVVCAQLRQGAFDCVLFGDVEQLLAPETARQLASAARLGGAPIIIVDMLDDFMDSRARMTEYLGVSEVAGYFKREMLIGLEYDEAWPLPFAYSETYAPREFHEGPRDLPIFWAGNRKYGLRRLALEYLESTLEMDFSALLLQDEYAARLQRSQIALDFAGFGFDTVRYWEIPAHGAMLLAERRPTLIPYDYTDGESAVFFDDLPDLEQKLAHYLAHPGEAAEIARRGYAHFHRHHTATHRARHVLGWLQSRCDRT